MAAPKGNQNGRKENRLITDALRRVVTQNPEKLKIACEKVLEDAMEGDKYALSFIADRLDGKPSQSVDMTVTQTSHEDALDALEHGSDSTEHHATH